MAVAVALSASGRGPSRGLRAGLLVVALLSAAAAAAAAVVATEEECAAASGGRGCPGVVAQPEAPALAQQPPAPSPPPLEGAPAGDGANASTEPRTKITREELGVFRLGFVLALLGSVVLWIAATIKFALDGSLPARLALWGLLPEAYAAISVRAVAHLLRLKSGTTPVVVLRNCVTDAGAEELAEAMRLYGKKADLQALELPHNLKMGRVGIQHLAAGAVAEGSNLQEIDISYNPQLGDAAVAVLMPLLKPKASKVNALKLADCGLSVDFVKQMADVAARSSLRILDLSYNSLAGAGEVLAEVCEAPVLEDLTLTCCGLRTTDVAALAEQLPYTSIRSLQLGGNRFGNAGLLALTEHLPGSQIDELGLEANDIEAAALSCLGEAWAKRPFARIRLNGNRMTQAEVQSFVRALRSIHG